MGLPRGLLGGPWEGLFGPWARPIWPSWRPISWFLRLGRPIWASQEAPNRASQRPYLGPILRPFWARPGPEAPDFMVPQAGEAPGASQEGPKRALPEAPNRPQKGPILGPILRAQITLSFD